LSGHGAGEVAQASVEELAAVPGMTEAAAKAVVELMREYDASGDDADASDE